MGRPRGLIRVPSRSSTAGGSARLCTGAARHRTGSTPAVHDSRHGTLQTVSRGATTDQRYARPRRPSHPLDELITREDVLERVRMLGSARGARRAHRAAEDRADFRWKRRFHVKRIPLPRSRGAFGPEWGESATETPGAEGIGRDRWRIAPASGSLGRLSVCRIPASTFNTCTTLLLQKYCSRFSPKEVG